MDKIKRFELKYHLSTKCLTDFRRDIRCFLSDDPHNHIDGCTMGYKIRTLYFESADGYCYDEKMAGASDRTKLRIRAYLPIGPDKKYVLEIKRKENDITWKHRSMINSMDVQDLISGNHNEVLKRHAGDSIIHRFILEKSYKMLNFSIAVDYHREAFMNIRNSRYVRANLDTEMKWLPSRLFFDNDAMPEGYSPLDKYAVCEFKYEDKAPYWMFYMIQKYDMEAMPFSKYSQGLDRSHHSLSQQLFGQINQFAV